MSTGDLFMELVEHCDTTAVSPDQASEEFAAACRRFDKDPRERQRIADIANLIDTEDAIYTQALSALGRGEQDTALPLLRQAAEAGIGEAAWLLAGRLEEQGRTQESHAWYQRAAADGNPRAARRIHDPFTGRAEFNSYQPASAVPGNAERPVRSRARKLFGSGWVTSIVVPATAAAAVATVIAIAVAIATVFPLRGASPGQGAASHATTSRPAAEAAARMQAVTWILHQASPAAIVSCDPQVCTDLASRGFPSSNLLPLAPASKDPLGSALVVATATIRNQFGSRLAVYAPATIASFGTGNARIDIRWYYPGGAKAYRAALPAALRTRKAADAELLTNSNISLSATAPAQLLSGQIDPRLSLLITSMAHSHPLRVVDFAAQSPGGGPASLLRWADLATTMRAAHLTRAAYLHWMRSFIHAQRAEYRPAWVQKVTLPNGQAVLRIGYGAPSPLG